MTSTSQISVSEVNLLDGEQFERVFGNVVELCTNAAVQVRKMRPFRSHVELCAAFNKYLGELSIEEKLVILKSHPDLAGRLAASGGLTRESTSEQRSAGLHELTEEQKNIIDECNQRYNTKFGFPFIICARENKVQSIIEGLRRRYNNTRNEEINIAIEEVKKICNLRTLDIVSDE